MSGSEGTEAWSAGPVSAGAGAPERREPLARVQATAAPPGVVGLPGHGPAGGGHRGHQGVGVGLAQGGRHLLLLLEEEAGPARARPGGAARPGPGPGPPGHPRWRRCRRSRPAPGRASIRAWRAPTSRRPPWDSLRSGSSRKATSPWLGVPLLHQVGQDAQPRGLLLLPPLPGPVEDRLGHLGGRRRSPGRRAARGPPGGPRRPCRGPRSGRRTLWSRETPSSHTGYQMRSAMAETSRRPLWSRTTSRSL